MTETASEALIMTPVYADRRRIDALGVHILGENRSQIITNEFNMIAQMPHRARRCPRVLVAATCL